MKNRQFFKNESKKDQYGNRPCDSKIASDYPELMSELYYRQLLLSNTFINWTACDAFRWIEGYADYINKYSKLKVGEFAYNTDFKAWDIIRVDLFGAFKNEMEYDHPALILKVLKNGLLVVIPITSENDTYAIASGANPPKDLIALPKNVSNLGNMKKNSTLLLSHIKVISKNRVLQRKFEVVNSAGTSTLQKKVIRNKATKDLINKNFAELYSGSYIHQLNSEKNKLERDYSTLMLKLEEEKDKYRELEDKYDKAQAALEKYSMAEKKNP